MVERVAMAVHLPSLCVTGKAVVEGVAVRAQRGARQGAAHGTAGLDDVLSRVCRDVQRRAGAAAAAGTPGGEAAAGEAGSAAGEGAREAAGNACDGFVGEHSAALVAVLRPWLGTNDASDAAADAAALCFETTRSACKGEVAPRRRARRAGGGGGGGGDGGGEGGGDRSGEIEKPSHRERAGARAAAGAAPTPPSAAWPRSTTATASPPSLPLEPAASSSSTPAPPRRAQRAAKAPTRAQREACEVCGLLLHSLQTERRRLLAEDASSAEGGGGYGGGGGGGGGGSGGGKAARPEGGRKATEQRQAAQRRESEARLRVGARLEARLDDHVEAELAFAICAERSPLADGASELRAPRGAPFSWDGCRDLTISRGLALRDDLQEEILSVVHGGDGHQGCPALLPRCEADRAALHVLGALPPLVGEAAVRDEL